MAVDYLDQCFEVIRVAEKGLQDLLRAAADSGDYEAMVQILAYAKELRRIAGNSETGAKAAFGANPSEYPKFFRAPDRKLVMVGWSKRSQTEYEHRAPDFVLTQLVDALVKGSPSGEPVPIDQLLSSLKDEEGGTELPTYYGRTYLRWLRAIKLLQKHGHQGYAICKPASFRADVSTHWKRLALRNY